MISAEKQEAVSVVMTVGGVLVFFTAMFAPRWFSNTGGWNNEMAIKLQQASMNYHDAIHRRGRASNDPGAPADQAFENARRDYEQLHGEMNRARTGGGLFMAVIRWGGFAVATCGVILFALARFRPDAPQKTFTHRKFTQGKGGAGFPNDRK